MKLIVGLGNPGLCYKDTKHNAGFWVVEKVSKEFKSPFSKRKFNARWSQGKCGNKDFILLKPMTFMNLSGQTVKSFVNYFKISPDEILIIFDDIHLRLGTIRIKASGTAGGHNGVQSVIDALGTDNFARLRFGIDTQVKYTNLTKNVLSSFRGKEDTKIKEKTVELAKEAVLNWFNKGIIFAMNNYNKKGRKETDHE